MKNFLKKFSGLEKKIKNATISKRSSQIESLEDGEDEYDASTEDELEEDEEYEERKDEDYLYKECYWGSFSRSIILPVEVEADKIEAFLENGVLTVTLPKAKNAKQISIKVREK